MTAAVAVSDFWGKALTVRMELNCLLTGKLVSVAALGEAAAQTEFPQQTTQLLAVVVCMAEEAGQTTAIMHQPPQVQAAAAQCA